MKKHYSNMPLIFNGIIHSISVKKRRCEYISLKTLWNNRNIVAKNNLEDDNCLHRQMSSMSISQTAGLGAHQIQHFGRIGIFSESIHKFLVNINS